jgi:uncharacterized protein
MITKISNIEEKLKKTLFDMKSVIVAYSGGVDSSYLMDVANETLGKKALAVMSFSPSVAQDDRDDAIKLAKSKNWNYKVINTNEMEDENYVKNDIDRCFFCKNELYGTLVEVSNKLGFEWVVNGSNLDDKGDYRPGMKAANMHKVRSPLIENEFTKEDIRKFASKRNLETWDRPASPCLSSRLPYGTKVTVEALLMVSNSEKYLRSLGFNVVRVRHYETKAVIEIPKEKFTFFKKKHDDISHELKKYGYEFIELEQKGFRSGSLNIKAGIRKKTQS